MLACSVFSRSMKSADLERTREWFREELQKEGLESHSLGSKNCLVDVLEEFELVGTL